MMALFFFGLLLFVSQTFSAPRPTSFSSTNSSRNGLKDLSCPALLKIIDIIIHGVNPELGSANDLLGNLNGMLREHVVHNHKSRTMTGQNLQGRGASSSMEFSDCITGKLGTYKGQISRTMDNKNCLRWSDRRIIPKDATLLQNIREAIRTQDGTLEHNYCRNPSGAMDVNPWCYHEGATKKENNGTQRWSYCNVDTCPGIACFDGDIIRFGGMQNTYNLQHTMTGKKCISWYDPRIQNHNNDPQTLIKIREELAANDGYLDHNYCRKFTIFKDDPHPMAWCYHEGAVNPENRGLARWEYCGVVLCHNAAKLSGQRGLVGRHFVKDDRYLEVPNTKLQFTESNMLRDYNKNIKPMPAEKIQKITSEKPKLSSQTQTSTSTPKPSTPSSSRTTTTVESSPTESITESSKTSMKQKTTESLTSSSSTTTRKPTTTTSTTTERTTTIRMTLAPTRPPPPGTGWISAYDDHIYHSIPKLRIYGKNAIQIEVRACHTSMIALYDKVQNSYYQIKLNDERGRSSILKIMYGGEYEFLGTVIVTSEKLLDCDHVKSFWITWNKGSIRVGKGTEINRQLLMHWLDSQANLKLTRLRLQSCCGAGTSYYRVKLQNTETKSITSTIITPDQNSTNT